MKLLSGIRRRTSLSDGWPGCFFATFWTVIFTGAVRKWMFPGVSVLYLLQDVPIVFAYLYAIWSGLFTRNYLMLYTILLSAVITLQALAQIVFSGLDTVVAGVGLHNYLFYLPILFVFPFVPHPQIPAGLCPVESDSGLPMCLLAMAQSVSPKQAFVNRTSEGEAFGLSGADVVRVSGTFNFTTFYSIWVGLAVALCMGEWLLPKETASHQEAVAFLSLHRWPSIICHLVSGSRSAIALAGRAVLGAMVAAVASIARALLAIGGIWFFSCHNGRHDLPDLTGEVQHRLRALSPAQSYGGRQARPPWQDGPHRLRRLAQVQPDRRRSRNGL